MNVEAIHKLWACYLDGITLSDPEQTALAEAWKKDPKLQIELSADRAVHNLIPLSSEPEDTEEFVAQCLVRFRKLALSKAAMPVAGTQPIDIELKRPSVGLHRHYSSTRTRRTTATWLTVSMAIASMIVLGCFLIVIRSSRDPDLTDMELEKEETPAIVTGVTEEAREVQIVKSLPTINEVDPDENERQDPVSEEEQIVEAADPSNLLQRDVETPDAEKTMATVTRGAHARFAAAIVDDRIAAGSKKLMFGTATITMDNGVAITLVAPAEVSIASPEQISIDSGRVKITTPVQLEQFEIQFPDSMISNFDQANLVLFVNKIGTEIVVTSGQCDLIQSKEISSDSSRTEVFLSADSLSHAFVGSTTIRDSTPSVVVAHGAGKYLGQLAFNNDVDQAASPLEFEKKLQEFENGQIDDPNRVATTFHFSGRPLEELSDSRVLFQYIGLFNNMFRQLGQTHRDGSAINEQTSRGYSFQGEIVIDGMKVEFTSPEEFKKYSEQLKNR